MASNAPVQFSFAGLPGGEAYCFTTPQRFALDITAGLSGYLPGTFNKIINSNTEPSVDDRVGSLWYKTSEGRFYHYDGGWISPNPAEALGDERRIFVGSESDIWSYDGGDGSNPSTTTPTANTGAMWEKDGNFDFRFPLGAGTSPAPNNTVVGVGDTGGEEKHLLTIPELPAHRHDIVVGVGASTFAVNGGSSGSVTQTDNTSIQTTGGDTAHNTMPPYRGVFFIRRTNRANYTA